MKKIIVRLLMLFFLAQISASGYGQETGQKPEAVSFFLDCWACDFNFVRQELPFVAFVRDPQLADVHILVTQAHTGSGRHKYFLNFIGKNPIH
ncbi:MAG: elongation factor P maturation arginine rhamnosyltransferase EarP [Ignavibacteriales bacterium]|nr:elongation factor P maturation arginine rhamnosyltransferase EarP [Ignavibacteriales bacterium]